MVIHTAEMLSQDMFQILDTAQRMDFGNKLCRALLPFLSRLWGSRAMPLGHADTRLVIRVTGTAH